MPAQWGSELWGLSPVPGAPLPGCDATNSLNDLWYRLGFLSSDDMTVDDRWVTLTELYQFADEAMKRLAWSLSIFKTYDASVTVTAGTALYQLPPHHVFTVLAWLTSSPVQFLRLTSVQQLWALDAQWAAASGSPVRLSLDAGGTGTATLYPAPAASGTLAQIQQESPHYIHAGASDIPMSPIAQDYFTYAMLQMALSKESDHARPEVADHCVERMHLYEKIFDAYWGPGE